MQVSPSTTASVASTSGSVVDQVKRQAAILSDASGASTAEKTDAYISIFKAMAQSANTGAGWFQQSTQADRDAVNAIMDTASVARDIRQAADDFNARGMRADRTTNVMADQIRYLDSLPDQQQKMIFAGTASFEQTGSLDSWKAFLQQNADGRTKQLADEAAATPAVKVTLSDAARKALGQDTAATPATDPASKALETLTRSQSGPTIAETALRMLEDAAARQDALKDRNILTPGYQAGDHIDATA